jgi:hypothetical protein
LDLDRRPALVKIDDVLTSDGLTDDEPRWCQYVFLVLVDAGPDIAVVFCGSTRDDLDRGVRETLYILDADVVYFHPGLWGELATRLKDMGTKWHVQGAAIFAPEHLAAPVEGLGVTVETLAPDFKPELWLTFCSECVGKKWVRFCAPVKAKMNTQTIAAALALRAGDEVEGALRAALISAVCLKFDVNPVRRLRKRA